MRRMLARRWRVMSFNIRYGRADDGDDQWEKSKGARREDRDTIRS